MKKIIAVFLVIVTLGTCLMLTGCDGDIIYTADSDFYYSADKGATYGNRTKEYSVGETIYMQVMVNVISSSEKIETVKVKLTIPNVTSVSAKYYDGQIITPNYDTLNNVTIYEFTVPVSSASQPQSFFFQFIPNEEAEVKMTLEFDDKIDSMFDKQNTIKFVAAEATVDGE